MKNIFIICLLLVSVHGHSASGTGRSVMGPATMGQPAYPNSGPLRNRSTDMTGEDMSNATLMGSDVDPTVPSENPQARNDNNVRDVIPDGPYVDKKKDHSEEGPDGKQAQEAAQEGGFGMSSKTMKQKQHGR